VIGRRPLTISCSRAVRAGLRPPVRAVELRGQAPIRTRSTLRTGLVSHEHRFFLPPDGCDYALGGSDVTNARALEERGASWRALQRSAAKQARHVLRGPKSEEES